MARKFLFADEHGNFDFRDHTIARNGPTRFFAVGTAMIEDESHLAIIRARMGSVSDRVTWDGLPHAGFFHASEDMQAIRNEVYAAIADLRVKFDVTILEKSKARPDLYAADEGFFKYAWFYHLNFLAGRYFRDGDEWLIVAGSLDVKKRRKAFQASVTDVVNQCVHERIKRRVTFRDTRTEPGLQLADYGLWAVMRRYNFHDARAEDAIRHNIRHVHDLFSAGHKHYYGPLA